MILGVIPARYASTRFPAKPLADIRGKSMIQRVYEQALKAPSLSAVVVATDHPAIEAHVKSFGGQVVMTSPAHQSGTDRCFEVLSHMEETFEHVINIQGDEPFIDPRQIEQLATLLKEGAPIATLAVQLHDLEKVLNPNHVKVIWDNKGQAIYFSRHPIPFVRNHPQEHWLEFCTFHKHIGLYGYRAEVLSQITQLPISKLEQMESLEQLRWIENGQKIALAVTEQESIGIDTPEDLEKVLSQWPVAWD